MTRLTCCLVLLWLGMPVLAFSQGLPPKPASGLADDTRVFSDEEAQGVRDALATARDRDGVAVYVATFAYVTGDIRSYTTELKNAWLGEDPGIVLAYSRGQPTPAMLMSDALWRRYPTDEIVTALDAATFHLVNQQVPLGARMSRAAKALTDAIAKMDEARRQRAAFISTADKRLALVTTGVLVLMAAAVWIMINWAKRKTVLRQRSYRFPEVEMPTRLGAPYGGGVMATAANYPAAEPRRQQ